MSKTVKILPSWGRWQTPQAADGGGAAATAPAPSTALRAVLLPHGGRI